MLPGGRAFPGGHAAELAQLRFSYCVDKLPDFVDARVGLEETVHCTGVRIPIRSVFADKRVVDA